LKNGEDQIHPLTLAPERPSVPLQHLTTLICFGLVPSAWAGAIMVDFAYLELLLVKTGLAFLFAYKFIKFLVKEIRN